MDKRKDSRAVDSDSAAAAPISAAEGLDREVAVGEADSEMAEAEEGLRAPRAVRCSQDFRENRTWRESFLGG